MYRQIPPSSTLLLNEQSAALAEKGQQVYRFGFGQSPFPICQLLEDALKQNAYRKAYTPVQGIVELRESVAAFHSKFEQRSVHADQVFIAPGSKSLLYTIMCAYADAAVLIPAPAWVSYAPQAELLGHQAILMQTDYAQRYRITAEILERHLIEAAGLHKTLLVVLNSPGNPDGLCYDAWELADLAAVLDKYQAWVISDEIYAPLQHQNQHVSMAKYYPQRTFVTSGLSKWAGAGGWRLGVAILPETYDSELKQAMLGIASETYSCASTPIQYAALAAYSGHPLMEEYVGQQRNILQGIGNLIYLALTKIGIRAHAPQGGFYLLIDFSAFREALDKVGLSTDSQLCSAILNNTGVALLPGVAFGLPQNALAARLAYVDFDGKQALEDISLQDWNMGLSKKHGQKMLNGIAKLGDYLATLSPQ